MQTTHTKLSLETKEENHNHGDDNNNNNNNNNKFYDRILNPRILHGLDLFSDFSSAILDLCVKLSLPRGCL